jgi:hypothetical protein
MNGKIIFPIAAMVALGACDYFQGDRVEATNNVANTSASAGNESAVAAPSGAGISSSRSLAGLSGGGAGGGKDPGGAIEAGSAGTIDPRFVGRWTDNGDCKQVMELRPDGTFLASSGVTGTWRVEGGELNFVTNDGVIPLRIDSVEPDRIVTTNAEGNTGPSTRC